MIHVGHTQQQLWPAVGGGEWTTLQVARALSRSGAQVTVFATDLLDLHSGARVPAGVEREGQLTIVRQRGYLLGPSVVVTPGLLPALKDAHLDVIHAHGFGYVHSELAAALARMRDIPLVVSTHGYFPMTKRIHPGLSRLYTFLARHNLLQRASRVLVDSETEREIYATLCDEGKIEILPEEVLTVTEVSRPPGPTPFRSRFNIDGPYFLCLGRITESKGFQNVIAAIPKFLSMTDAPNARFVFMGPDWGYLTSLRRLIGESGLASRVLVTGVVEQMLKHSAIAGAVAVVVPSFYETYGMVVTEAMAMGVPVVGTKFGGARPRITDGVNGRLVDPADSSELADAMAWAYSLLDSQRTQVAVVSRSRVLEKYTLESTTERLLKLYAEVAEPIVP